MTYPNYQELPSFGGKRFNTAASLAYEAFAVQFFLHTEIEPGKNYSIYNTSGVLGNTQQESQFNPAIQGDPHIPGRSNGIQQWNNKRNLDMMNYVSKMFDGKSYYDLTEQEKFWGQLHFCNYEIHSKQYKKALQLLIDHETDPDLAGRFGHLYEGYGDNSASKRDAFAKVIVDSYKAGKFDLPEDNHKVGVFLTKPQIFTIEQFKAFLDTIDLKKMQWSPRYVTLHNTAMPDLKTWNNYSPSQKQQWPANLNHLYKNVNHWHSGVFGVAMPDGTFVMLSNIYEDEIHAIGFNKISFGIEMLADFDHDDYTQGQGKTVLETAVAITALINNKFGWTPLPFKLQQQGLHFHRDNLVLHNGDTHICPSLKLKKEYVIPMVQAKMNEFKKANVQVKDKSSRKKK